MSVPRSLSLRRDAFNDEEPASYVLVQKPIRELERLRVHSRDLNATNIAWPPKPITEPSFHSDLCCELEAVLRPGTARSVGFRLRTGDKEFTEVAYDRNYAAVYVDRKQSGND